MTSLPWICLNSLRFCKKAILSWRKFFLKILFSKQMGPHMSWTSVRRLSHRSLILFIHKVWNIWIWDFWVWIGFRAPHYSNSCVEVVPLVLHHCPKLDLWNAQRPKYPTYSWFMVIFLMVSYMYLHTMYEKSSYIFEKNCGAAQVILTHLHPECQMITIHNMYGCNLIQIQWEVSITVALWKYT